MYYFHTKLHSISTKFNATQVLNVYFRFLLPIASMLWKPKDFLADCLMGNNTQCMVQSESTHIGLIYAVIFQSKVKVDIRT